MLHELIRATERELQNFNIDELDEYNKGALLFNVMTIVRCVYDSTVIHNRKDSCANIGIA